MYVLEVGMDGYTLYTGVGSTMVMVWMLGRSWHPGKNTYRYDATVLGSFFVRPLVSCALLLPAALLVDRCPRPCLGVTCSHPSALLVARGRLSDRRSCFHDR